MEEIMVEIINTIFKGLAIAFDKIPFLNKIKGYRSVLGFVGMGVIALLKMQGIGDAGVLDAINIGLIGFAGLSLNAKDNS